MNWELIRWGLVIFQTIGLIYFSIRYMKFERELDRITAQRDFYYNRLGQSQETVLRLSTELDRIASLARGEP